MRVDEQKNSPILAAIKMKSRTVVGRGKKSPLSDAGFKSRLLIEREKEKGKKVRRYEGMSKKRKDNKKGVYVTAVASFYSIPVILMIARNLPAPYPCETQIWGHIAGPPAPFRLVRGACLDCLSRKGLGIFLIFFPRPVAFNDVNTYSTSL